MEKRLAILKRLYDAIQRTSLWLIAAILLAVLIPATAHFAKAEISVTVICASLSVGLAFALIMFFVQQVSINVNDLMGVMQNLKIKIDEIRAWEEVYAKLKKIDVGTLLTCTMKEADEKRRLSRIVPINFYIEAAIKNKETALSLMADEIQDKKDAFSNSAKWCRKTFIKKCKRYCHAFGLEGSSFYGVVA